ncbi:MAG: hypothetical protein O3C21_16310 [Verrucomicrobia bacterium]|nr:hypothetical protein [Verrucomicrobiota bacterium]
MQFENVPRRFAGVLPVGEVQILDLMRALMAANGAEQMPAPVMEDGSGVLDRIAGIARAVSRCHERRGGLPPEVASDDRIAGRCRGEGGDKNCEHAENHGGVFSVQFAVFRPRGYD